MNNLNKKSKNILDNIGHIVLYLFLTSIIIFPAIFQPFKIGLLALLVSYVVLITLANNGKFYLHKYIYLWLIFYLCLGLGFSFLGVLNGAPKIIPILTLYVIFPVVYVIIITQINTKTAVKNIVRLLIFITFPVSLLVIIQMLSVWGVAIPGYKYLLLAYSENGLTSEISYMPRVLSSLVFLSPFILGCFVTYTKNGTPVSRPVLWTSLLICSLAIILSQRRAIIFITILFPFFVLLLTKYSNYVYRRYIYVRLMKLIVIMVIVAGISLPILKGKIGYGANSLFIDFISAFDFEGELSAKIRLEQMSVLINALSQNALFGAGLGVGVYGYTRDDLSPWNYEMRYVALLYQTGVIGFLLYISGIIWMFCMGVKAIAEGKEFKDPVLVMFCGLFGALTAEAINPTLNQFGHLWMIFIPLAVINIWLLERKRQSTTLY
jgi:hypothetical protein